MESQMVLFNKSSTGLTQDVYPLDNCEVARVESPTSINRPAITFKLSQIYINAGLIKCAPEMVYVLFLIDCNAKKLILRPCDRREREAVQLRTLNESAPKPRHITGTDFNFRLFEFMEWDMEFRYRVSGNLINSNNVTLIVFDLESAVKFELSASGKISLQKLLESYSKRSGNFGITVEEQRSNPLVTQFAEDTIIPIEIQDNSAKPVNSSDNTDAVEHTEFIASVPEVMTE